jgi:hypothetical protein
MWRFSLSSYRLSRNLSRCWTVCVSVASPGRPMNRCGPMSNIFCKQMCISITSCTWQHCCVTVMCDDAVSPGSPGQESGLECQIFCLRLWLHNSSPSLPQWHLHCMTWWTGNKIWVLSSLHYAFSVTRLNSIDDRIISEWEWIGKDFVRDGRVLI